MSTEQPDDNLYPFTPPPPPLTSGPSSSPTPKRRARSSRRSRITKTAAGLALVMGTGTGVAAVVVATSSSPRASLAAASSATTTTDPASTTTTSPAATTTTTPSNSPAVTTPSVPGELGRPRFFGGGRFGLGVGPGFLGPIMGMGQGGVVHASYTFKGPNGDYETVDTQYGTAQAVSSSSITVKSADGFSQTYEVGSGTLVNADYEGILSVNVGDEVTIEAVANGSTITAERVIDLTQVQANRQSWLPGPGNNTSPPSGSGGTGPSAA